MRCPQCHFENEVGSKFCGNCGATLSISQPIEAGQLYCTSCGTRNPPDSLFCENCGSKLVLQESQHVITSAPQYAPTAKKTSAAWWLMPIFLMWIGGVVAWLVVRETDKAKAKHMLWLGIATTFFWPIFWGLLGTCMGPRI